MNSFVRNMIGITTLAVMGYGTTQAQKVDMNKLTKKPKAYSKELAVDTFFNKDLSLYHIMGGKVSFALGLDSVPFLTSTTVFSGEYADNVTGELTETIRYNFLRKPDGTYSDSVKSEKEEQSLHLKMMQTMPSQTRPNETEEHDRGQAAIRLTDMHNGQFRMVCEDISGGLWTMLPKPLTDSADKVAMRYNRQWDRMVTDFMNQMHPPEDKDWENRRKLRQVDETLSDIRKLPKATYQ